MSIDTSHKVHSVVVSQIVPSHQGHKPGEECWMIGCGGCSSSTAFFTVDTNTWKCEGEIEGAIVLVDPELWEKLKAAAVKFAKETLKDAPTATPHLCC